MLRQLSQLFLQRDSETSVNIPTLYDAYCCLSKNTWKKPIDVLDELKRKGYTNPTKHLRGHIFAYFSGLEAENYLEARVVPSTPRNDIEYKKLSKGLPVPSKVNETSKLEERLGFA